MALQAIVACSDGRRIITTISANLNETETDGKKGPDAEAELKLSLKQPVWHVLVLTVLTLKMYFIYWCYKNWRDLSRDVACRTRQLEDSAGSLDAIATPAAEASNTSPAMVEQQEDLVAKLLPAHLSSFKDTSPILRAIGVVVPYLNNYLFFTLALGIAKLSPNKRSMVASHPVICSLLILSAWITLSLLAFLPGALYFTFLLCVVPVAIVQHWLNKYWDAVEEKGLLTRHGFTFGEMVVIIAGALALGYLVSSFIMGSAR